MDWWKKKNNKSPRAVLQRQRLVRERERGEILLQETIQCCDGKSNPIKCFSADEILEATDTFSESNRVSQLYDDFPFDWYSGKQKDNNNDHHHTILIKKWRYRLNDHNRGNFCRDIAMSSMVSGHKNFLKLMGCSLESENPVLVYHAVEKKPTSLDLKTVVSWRERLKIAEDIAIALAYLHTAFPRPFVYRIMRLGDILLDENGAAKLSNFSHCVSIPLGETFVKLGFRCVGGDYDYMDDDYLLNGVVSEKTDVFSFGVFMQKLLTGEERFRELNGRRTEWLGSYNMNVPRCWSNTIGEFSIYAVVDPHLLEKMGRVSEEEHCQMKAFLVLAERCIGLGGEVPKMVEVAKELKRFIKNASSPSYSTEIHM
ncbi:unnamed protein product [Microthlaspi erraticum]|uniref:Protein kinase domain-containing protein n=1 Tax=Microthlaspi erraticum TaxID=1685480 RepID=A0A6D2L844_9BRAS|nr:unnamed protein product [Microthlaspi erraticum]